MSNTSVRHSAGSSCHRSTLVGGAVGLAARAAGTLVNRRSSEVIGEPPSAPAIPRSSAASPATDAQLGLLGHPAVETHRRLDVGVAQPAHHHVLLGAPPTAARSRACDETNAACTRPAPRPRAGGADGRTIVIDALRPHRRRTAARGRGSRTHTSRRRARGLRPRRVADQPQVLAYRRSSDRRRYTFAAAAALGPRPVRMLARHDLDERRIATPACPVARAAAPAPHPAAARTPPAARTAAGRAANPPTRPPARRAQHPGSAPTCSGVSTGAGPCTGRFSRAGTAPRRRRPARCARNGL